MLPLPARALSPASAGVASLFVNKCCSISAVVSGENLIAWQRDLIVGSSIAGREVMRMMWEVGGGSSRVFNRALADGSLNLSASSTMNTRALPSKGRKLASPSIMPHLIDQQRAAWAPPPCPHRRDRSR